MQNELVFNKSKEVIHERAKENNIFGILDSWSTWHRWFFHFFANHLRDSLLDSCRRLAPADSWLFLKRALEKDTDTAF